MELTQTLTRPLAGPAADTAIRTILVSVAGADADRPLLGKAAAMACTLRAHLQVLYTHIDPQELAIRMGAWDPMGAAGLGAMIDDVMKDADIRQQSAKLTFDEVCGNVGLHIGTSAEAPSAEWITDIGVDSECLVARGRAADLIVFVRGVTPEETPIHLLEASLIGCGKPILVLPSGPARFSLERIAIAWKDTPEAARAITAALPFVRQAESVLLMSVEEEGSGTNASPDWVLAGLRRHNSAACRVRLSAESRDPVGVLLKEAAGHGAGLLVMGGYGHSRARETVFGGFTRSILRSAPLPVLIVH